MAEDYMKFESEGSRKVVSCLMASLFNFQTLVIRINHILSMLMVDSDNDFFGHEHLTETEFDMIS